MNYKIREASEADLDSIIELSVLLAQHHSEIDPGYWKDARYNLDSIKSFVKQDFSKSNQLWLVAECEEKIIGFFTGMIKEQTPLHVEERCGHITNAFLLKEFRGKGIAREATQKLLEWFKSQNIKLVELMVDTANDVGVRAWEKLGFKEYRKRMRIII